MATPGRLLDFVDRNRVSFEGVRFIVLDEADRMLDMGFIPSIEKMMDHPSMIAKVSQPTRGLIVMLGFNRRMDYVHGIIPFIEKMVIMAQFRCDDGIGGISSWDTVCAWAHALYREE